jgi:hypothetical protein
LLGGKDEMKCKRCLSKYPSRHLKGKKARDRLCAECRQKDSEMIIEERAYWQGNLKVEPETGEIWS